ncbi:MAG: AAA family ATPase [Legionellales bacterium]|nr:AAA family ATPase [Legionellales bacterium]
MTSFIGRAKELKELDNLLEKPTASLVILQGRRRIGKSRLIEEFAKDKLFYVLSGIPPTAETTKQSELNEFARQLHIQTGLPEIIADDWSKLFLLLSEKTKQGRVIILFDEISWMGSKDPDFLGKLKNAWDLYFKKNPKLILILCGSVSSWIEKNIVRSTGFMGRPSMYMTLEELPLNECNKFWNKQDKNVSAFEKFKIFTVTGGVPRYLELLNPKISAEENIKRLCFSKNAPLINEFEHIFSDIFSKRSEIYKNIVKQLVKGPATADELAENVGLVRTGTFDDYLNDLVLAGFIARDYTWHLKTGKTSKLSEYRLKDNYVRFYLKYILPNKTKIEKDRYKDVALVLLPGWEVILGLQFENLVLNNHAAIIQLLGIKPEEVVADNPFFQRPTARQKGCQIDYLIQTKFDTVYICEIKFSKRPIGMNVVSDMKEKISRLKIPRHVSCRPVLIHVNGVTDELLDADYFSNIIDFGELLRS